MTSVLDRWVPICLAGAYVLAAMLVAPGAQRAFLLVVGLCMGGLVILTTHFVRPSVPSTVEMGVVTFAAAGILFVPTFPAMGGAGGTTSVVAGVGSQIIVLLWAARRWPWRRGRATPRSPLGEVLRSGVLMAAGISVLATIPIGLHLVSEGAAALPLLFAYPAYLVGGLMAAITYWSLQAVAESATGRYLIGVLCGWAVYLAVAPIVVLLNDEPLSVPLMLGLAYVCGSLAGPCVSLSWDATA